MGTTMGKPTGKFSSIDRDAYFKARPAQCIKQLFYAC